MLNIGGLKDGIVLDHIEAGRSLDIYYHLGLDKLECQVAIIKNARSNKMGRKDIIKIEGSMDLIQRKPLPRPAELLRGLSGPVEHLLCRFPVGQ